MKDQEMRVCPYRTNDEREGYEVYDGDVLIASIAPECVAPGHFTDVAAVLGAGVAALNAHRKTGEQR